MYSLVFIFPYSIRVFFAYCPHLYMYWPLIPLNDSCSFSAPNGECRNPFRYTVVLFLWEKPLLIIYK
jgi:hypothetical protein